MERRPQPTFADYIVIALSPALIMLLVGSLVFFLIEVFYRGDYDSRLSFIMAMFVMAAVLIARISIEESREYATLFAVPLGLVTLLALHRFVQFSGPLSSFSFVINIGLMAIVWWCSDRLTWDSTVIDERKDASGEGLLQTAGLEADGTTQNAAAEAAAARQTPQLNPWQRFVAYRRRPHSPGVWVIYFSIAALPIFGFGHWFIPSDDLDSRRYVFKLLVVYVAAGLGLLLTTAFLNLRRYLRQRRLEMPLEMAGTWIGTGAAMIVALLVVCMLLPRRNPEYSVTHLPFFAGSPTDLWTTEWAVGNEGQEDPDKGDRTGEQTSEDGEKTDSDSKNDDTKDPFNDPNSKNEKPSDSPSDPNGKQGSPSDDGGSKGEDSGNNKKSPSDQKGPGSSGKSNDPQSGDQKQKTPLKPGGKQGDEDKQKGPDSKDNKKRSPDSKNQSPNQDKSPQGEKQPNNSDNKQPGDTKSEPKSQPNKKQPGSPRKTNPRSTPQPQKKFDIAKVPSAMAGAFGWLLKLLYWVLAILIVGYFVWKYWRQVLAAIANFWKSLQDFWASLFGRKTVAAAAEASIAASAPPPKPFSAFHDPFLTGAAQSRPPIEVVTYSFEALEAWAREHGFPRHPEQTPQEFAQQVAANQGALGRDAAALADLYNRCAYSRDLGPRVNIEPLRRLWQQMRDKPAPPLEQELLQVDPS